MQYEIYRLEHNLIYTSASMYTLLTIDLLFLCSLCVSKIVCDLSLPMLIYVLCCKWSVCLCLEYFLRLENDLHAVYEDHLCLNTVCYASGLSLIKTAISSDLLIKADRDAQIFLRSMHTTSVQL